jgi:antitoxin (DNA-binding transcriptional repressor) of toxin-antitoxin stability system
VPIERCRQRLGWYAERTLLGDTFLLTRRGKPLARLIAP